MLFRRQWSRHLAIVFGAGWLVGCAATSKEVVSNLQGFVGLNVDALVTQYGPPTNTFKMNSGETSYVWQLTAQTNIDTDNGSGTAQTFYCKIKVVASATGVVASLATEDASNLLGESLCARRLGMRRSWQAQLGIAVAMATAFATGPKPGVHCSAFVAEAPKLTAKLANIKRSSFQKRRWSSQRWSLTSLIIRAYESPAHHASGAWQVGSLAAIDFGKKMDQTDQNYIVSSASALRDYLIKKGYKCSDDPP
jgi:hypothetical protein